MKKAFALITLALFAGMSLWAQSQEEQAAERTKKLYESIDTQVENATTALDLEDWQVFKIDSILTHDMLAMSQEFDELSAQKVSNSSLYMESQDRWMEQIYNAYHEVLNEEQWAKHLKNGAARAKKARDKRAAQIAKNQQKLKEKLGK